MAHRLTAWFIGLSLLSACGSGHSPSTDAAAVPKAALTVHCFESRMPDGSVLSFQYTDLAGQVVGVLDYDFKEKDGAHGTLRGQRNGDIITALWTHSIEGVTQVQQIVMRLENDRVVKANGELIAGADDVLRLKDRSAAAFNESFGRVQCD